MHAEGRRVVGSCESKRYLRIRDSKTDIFFSGSAFIRKKLRSMNLKGCSESPLAYIVDQVLVSKRMAAGDVCRLRCDGASVESCESRRYIMGFVNGDKLVYNLMGGNHIHFSVYE